MTCDLTRPIFTDDDDARAYLETLHWPDGPVCRHCGERERVTFDDEITGEEDDKADLCGFAGLEPDGADPDPDA